jgi:hypothetical protein
MALSQFNSFTMSARMAILTPYHLHWSPSGLPSYHDSDGSHEMNEAEIGKP